MGAALMAGKLTLRTLAEVPGIRQVLLDQAQSHGFDEHSIFAIRLALEEALTNAVRHGNAADPAKSVTVDYDVTDQQFKVAICDEGPGFEPSELPDCTAEENLQRPGGRGVMLMRAYMTRVCFNEKGNCVTLIKDRDCPKPRGDDEN